VFFARVLRSATEDSVRALFSRFGRVVEVNLFRAFQVCRQALVQGPLCWVGGLRLVPL
jgi:hypothetical protein